MICFVSWTERRSWHDADKYVVEDWWAVLGSETIAALGGRSLEGGDDGFVSLVGVAWCVIDI